MKNIYLLLSLFVVNGCASFVKLENKNEAFGVAQSLKNRISLSYKVVLKDVDREYTITPSEWLNKELNAAKGCDLSHKGYIMSEVATVNDAYGYRLICEVFNELKKYEGSKFIVVMQENCSVKECLMLDILVKSNETKIKKIWQIANILSFSIIPFWNRREYAVTWGVRDGESQDSSKYSTRTINLLDVRQLFLLPAMPFLDNLYSGTNKIHLYIANELIKEISDDQKK